MLSGFADRDFYVRFKLGAVGLEIAELYVPFEPGGGPITGTTLRHLPLGRIEAWANEPVMRRGVEANLRTGPTTDIATLIAGSAEGLAAEDVMVWEERFDLPPRSVDQGAGVGHGGLRPLPGILRPPGSKPYPDDFYRSVGEAYLQIAPTGQPAKKIAKRSKVPVTTVHGWIREARRRGFLPPGRKGKVG